MKESYSATTAYHSIEEIRARKALLQKDIKTDEEKIDEKWHFLFKKPQALSKSATPSQRITSIVNSSAGVLDGLLLVWKLYRKFKK
jgi:hypothetical protein